MTENIVQHTYIYGLCEPDTGEIRYVGKSDNPEIRYQHHHAPSEINSNTHKARWLKSLVSRNQQATLVILETVPVSEWEQAEIRWIATLRSTGARLTNGTSGGEGVVGGTGHSPETRARISDALRKRVRSKESYEKASKKLRGKPLPAAHRQKLSEAHKQWWNSLTDEERQEHLKHIPREWSEESRKKIGNTNRGVKRYPRTTSRFVGVCWYKRDNCWRANIKVGDKQVHLGYFETEIDAAIAYNHGALHYYGNNAKFNDVPKWKTIQPKKFSKANRKPIQMPLPLFENGGEL